MSSSRWSARVGVAVLALALSAAFVAPSRAAQPEPADYDEYVALGDSYTAGPLIPVVQPAGGCIRSTNNYPSLLADRLDVESFRDVSCSGADSTDMTSAQQTALGMVPPQFDALDADTDLVTVSVGGNDFSVFSKLVTVCPALRPQDPDGAPCRRHFGTSGRHELRESIDKTRQRLTDVVLGIRERSPDARILMVGYPPARTAPWHLPRQAPAGRRRLPLRRPDRARPQHRAAGRRRPRRSRVRRAVPGVTRARHLRRGALDQRAVHRPGTRVELSPVPPRHDRGRRRRGGPSLSLRPRPAAGVRPSPGRTSSLRPRGESSVVDRE